MKIEKYSLEQYKKIARAVAAEGCVLLENRQQALPLKKNDKVAIFGINAFHYYKSGLGSGGMVHADNVTGILDALLLEKNIQVDKRIIEIYRKYIEKNPFDEGYGWGTVPWSQAEMKMDEDEIRMASRDNDVAIIMIGRTAGEDQDHEDKKGSYRLTDDEETLIKNVCKEFIRSIVILNVGNIIDMSWVARTQPSSVLYVWQGGQEGGYGVADVLTGRISPCGKLPDTIANTLQDYPSTANFGDDEKNYYKEDIYVGYRYFETYAKDRVLYPFGYGQSYTRFKIEAKLEQMNAKVMWVKAKVENTGKFPGKEVVQVYVQAPQGKLGKPKRVLAGFVKTEVLKPGEVQQLNILCPKKYFAAFDDSGSTGFIDCEILEEGKYEVYCGSNVRDAELCGDWFQEEEIIERLSQQCAVVEASVKRFHFGGDEEIVPVRRIGMKEKIDAEVPKEIKVKNKINYTMKDLYEKKIDIEQFVGQLSEQELIMLSKGEGMCSKKGVPGVAGVFGGLTPELEKYGIPVVSLADGPSGIRMDCGTKAFSLPNGTCIASTFNQVLSEKLYEYLGIEMRGNGIDIILGPGINIHRNPLNGRNFEYFSEDPILTGVMSAALLRGLHKAGVEGTLKHFCANNQEKNRTRVEAVVSERALREIYLKPFEIAVKEGKAKSIMTTYGPVNGIWTSGNYELCTKILRDEWGFDGIVMTDWWAAANWENENVDLENRAVMIQAQNDLFMVCDDVKKEKDNVMMSLKNKRISKAQLQRNAKNIITFILHSLALKLKLGKIDIEECRTFHKVMQKEVIPDNLPCYVCSDKGDVFVEEGIIFEIVLNEEQEYNMKWKVSSRLGSLAQLPVSVFVDGVYYETISFRGTGGKWKETSIELKRLAEGKHLVKFVYEKLALQLKDIHIYVNLK